MTFLRLSGRWEIRPQARSGTLRTRPFGPSNYSVYKLGRGQDTSKVATRPAHAEIPYGGIEGAAGIRGGAIRERQSLTLAC